MIDRLVRELGGTQEKRPQPFSTYLDRSNLIVLGEPGSGKTTLFTRAQAVPYHARAFLSVAIDVLAQERELFIDALDEKRSGRADRDTVDLLTQRLWQLRPQKVRINCRETDWLGDSDLATFRGYFDRHGGVTILRLEPLTYSEQLEVLKAHGSADPPQFIHEAIQRGLGTLLGNPQNLVMLVDVVSKRRWPQNRGELFRSAADILLEEHNNERARSGAGRFSTPELKRAAGAICAARLISDVAGISLLNNSKDEQYPSYRTVDLDDPERVLATLGRRAFAVGALPETVDYVHRTVAEYLAADFLSAQIVQGLPLTRVRALLGVDGKPASELRGIHAWLAVLSTSSAQVLIDADPWGVVNYADAASLGSSQRRHLLSALRRLSEQNPRFRESPWRETPALGALSGKDVLHDFLNILEDVSVPRVLRCLVLDAIASGPPHPEAIEAIARIITNPSLSGGDRLCAVGALLSIVPAGYGMVCNLYPTLGIAEDDLRVRALVIERLKDTRLLPVESVAQLLNDAAASSEALVAGMFWKLDQVVADDDIPRVLDALSLGVVEQTSGETRLSNISEILIPIDNLLDRYCQRSTDLCPDLLLKWLEMRAAVADYASYGRSEQLRANLAANRALTDQLTTRLVHELVAGQRAWALHTDLSRILVRAVDNERVLDVLMYLVREESDLDGQRKVYETALSWCFGMGPAAREQFEQLCMLADGVAGLEEWRDRSSVCPVTPERYAHVRAHQDRGNSRAEARAKNQTDFERMKEDIRGGRHAPWMVFLAKVYFAIFSDQDQSLTPRQRIAEELGAENAEVAIEGLQTFASTVFSRPLTEIVELHSKDQRPSASDAVLAGLDALMVTGGIAAVDLQRLTAALALDLVSPIIQNRGQTSFRVEHPWKAWIIDRHQRAAFETYLSMARADLIRKSNTVYGLTELLRLEAFATFRAEAVLSLLRDFPNASRFTLRDLLSTAARELSHERLAENVQHGLTESLAAENRESYRCWLASAVWLGMPDALEAVDSLSGEEMKEFVWALRDGQIEYSKIQPEVLGRCIQLTALTYPFAAHPRDGWWGDTNPWDAAHFIHVMLKLLSSDPSSRAAAVLSNLTSTPVGPEYEEAVLSARADQLKRSIDARFHQPNWAETLGALANGPPANIEDLQALIIDHLCALKIRIPAANTDIFAQFWNQGPHGRLDSPKEEESCRDALVTLLDPLLVPLNVRTEPEGHMANDKRADIVLMYRGMKAVVELKRDSHPEVWTAIGTQLERLYARDPAAQGYGIYGVFWFGRPDAVRKTAAGERPQSAGEMEQLLQNSIPADRRGKTAIIVIDVSGVIP